MINESQNLSHSIVEINKKINKTIKRPINTMLESNYYFEPKYSIKEFIFEGLEIRDAHIKAESKNKVCRLLK